MSTSTMIRYRMDEDLKEKAESVFENMGLTPAAAIRLFYKQTVIKRALPFHPVAEDPFYSVENQEVLAESIRQLDLHRGKRHELIEA
ncbi:MAG: type II toxin-antitoxin system RelB/DinJ family antitoxin [Synergistaceae bacterium]|nr:type II toxin-antitoxin system RelB/DinJ family antitoxin [Synergistaceae bacterium]